MWRKDRNKNSLAIYDGISVLVGTGLCSEGSVLFLFYMWYLMISDSGGFPLSLLLLQDLLIESVFKT